MPSGGTCSLLDLPILFCISKVVGLAVTRQTRFLSLAVLDRLVLEVCSAV